MVVVGTGWAAALNSSGPVPPRGSTCCCAAILRLAADAPLGPTPAIMTPVAFILAGPAAFLAPGGAAIGGVIPPPTRTIPPVLSNETSAG